MEAERLAQLEALESSEDMTQMIRHQAVARWISYFTSSAGLSQELQATAKHIERQPSEPVNYMQRDSGRYDSEQ